MRNPWATFGIGAALLLSMAVPAPAQSEPSSEGLARSARQTASTPDSSPVTEREAKRALTRIENAIRKVILNNPRALSEPTLAATRTFTRTELLAELDRLFKLCRPKFKFTPRMSRVDREALAFPTGSPARSHAENLVAWGFLGRVIPMLTGPSETLTPQEFGDVLGFFLARVADLTHTPSAQWSPYLMRE